MDSVSIATIVGTIIAAVGLPLGILQYRRSNKPTEIKLPPPIEEKENLKVIFKANQKLSTEIQLAISEYITKHNAGQKLMFDNTTFGKYLEFLKENHEYCLSDSVYNRIDNEDLTRANISSLQKSLDEQTINLLNIKNRMKTLEV